ncbi:hypothetical protein KY328_05700 [Candidatus Woesearchaeota archaeon]|nr:hypothetical protein [Candidatus Woesearchaeota archaeon]MBW3022393.1 hypothetical protein [Candidatus Woesearchaeota archaeon]
MNSWIIRYGEIALKGKNRYLFEKKLVENIQKNLKKNKVKYKKIKKPRGRILISSDHDCSILKNVFGIVSISPAIECDPNLESIKETIEEQFLKKIKNNFRVSAKRIDKSIKQTSMQLNKEIGAFVAEKTGKKVKLKEFESEIGIEIVGKKAYIFDKRIQGYGGLPLGIEGEVYCLIEDESSLLASWLIMKRGCDVAPVAFKKLNVDLLNKFSVKDLKLKIIKNLKMLDRNKALVVNDTLKKIKQHDFQGLILRPLIAYSEEQINEELSKIR